MKLTTFRSIAYTGISLCLVAVLFSGCKKIFGLDRQKDVDHISTTIDPHINKTAWQYLKERATGAPNTPDTIFRRMYEGILYAEIDSNEYKQPGRTYIFLHNDAITRVASPVPTDTYWQRYKIGTAVGTKWSDYSKQQVKNWLLYLIVKGEYTYENLTPDNDTATTLLPLNTDPLNPNSIMTFKVLNDRDSKLRINDFFNTVRASQARTAGILSDNGPIHVLDRVVEFGVK